MSVDPVLSAGGRVAYASRGEWSGEPERLVEARRDLTASLLERHIRQAVAADPPMTAVQREQLALLLLRDAS